MWNKSELTSELRRQGSSFTSSKAYQLHYIINSRPLLLDIRLINQIPYNIYIHIYICMHTFMYVSMYVCMYIRISLSLSLSLVYVL